METECLAAYYLFGGVTYWVLGQGETVSDPEEANAAGFSGVLAGIESI